MSKITKKQYEKYLNEVGESLSEEQWANGEPDFNTRMELSKRSISRYLSGYMFRSIGSTIFKE